MILLKADKGLNDPEIMALLDVSQPTGVRIRKRIDEGGLEKALKEDPRPGQKRKIDDRGKAHLIAIACSQPPVRYDH